jgi:hypothetical protein
MLLKAVLVLRGRWVVVDRAQRQPGGRWLLESGVGGACRRWPLGPHLVWEQGIMSRGDGSWVGPRVLGACTTREPRLLGARTLVVLGAQALGVSTEMYLQRVGS